MTRETRAVPRKKAKAEAVSMPLTNVNFVILGVGLLAIALGYVALAQEPWDGVLPLVVAPILLVTGYCVLIPLGILYRRKADTQTPDIAARETPTKSTAV